MTLVPRIARIEIGDPDTPELIISDDGRLVICGTCGNTYDHLANALEHADREHPNEE